MKYKYYRINNEPYRHGVDKKYNEVWERLLFDAFTLNPVWEKVDAPIFEHLEEIPELEVFLQCL